MSCRSRRPNSNGVFFDMVLLLRPKSANRLTYANILAYAEHVEASGESGGAASLTQRYCDCRSRRSFCERRRARHERPNAGQRCCLKSDSTDGNVVLATVAKDPENPGNYTILNVTSANGCDYRAILRAFGRSTQLYCRRRCHVPAMHQQVQEPCWTPDSHGSRRCNRVRPDSRLARSDSQGGGSWLDRRSALNRACWLTVQSSASCLDRGCRNVGLLCLAGAAMPGQTYTVDSVVGDGSGTLPFAIQQADAYGNGGDQLQPRSICTDQPFWAFAGHHRRTNDQRRYVEHHQRSECA